MLDPRATCMPKAGTRRTETGTRRAGNDDSPERGVPVSGTLLVTATLVPATIGLDIPEEHACP